MSVNTNIINLNCLFDIFFVYSYGAIPTTTEQIIKVMVTSVCFNIGFNLCWWLKL